MTRALLVVDVQNDFCEGGSLAVSGGEKVAIEITQFLHRTEEDYIMTIGSRDYHIEPGEHFSDNPDYVNTWPAHCVAGTVGAEFHPHLIAEHNIDVEVLKGQHAAAYSAFEGVSPETNRSLDSILNEFKVKDLDICGIATDYCVKATVLGALKRDYNVRLLFDLTAAVDMEKGLAAIAELELLGARVVNSASIA